MQVHSKVIQIASLYVCSRVICRPIGIRHSEKNTYVKVMKNMVHNKFKP